MKTTIGSIARSMKSLVDLSNLDMPPAMAIRVHRALEVARREFTTYAGVEQTLIAKHHGVMDGIFVKFPDKAAEKAYAEAVAQADSVEIELPGERLTEADILTLEKVKPALLTDLAWFLAP